MHSKLISVLSWKLYTQNMIRKNVSCAYPCDPRESEIAPSRIERRCAHKTKERRDKNMTRSFDLILGGAVRFHFFHYVPRLKLCRRIFAFSPKWSSHMHQM